VETGDAIEMKELPFVMGVLADLSGHAASKLPQLRDRGFVEVTPDNFDDVLAAAAPTLTLTVDDKLGNQPGGRRNVSLAFENLDDFSPDAVARQVEPLRELLELREKLSDLRNRLQGNDSLNDILQKTLEDSSELARLKRETVGAEGTTNG
jgi:type VI secretion system protein ImpB